MTTVYLIRHGQTDTNIFDGINGSASNQPLNETGLAMAANLTPVFADVPLDAIYASNLTRAIQTAEGVRGTRKMEIVTDPDLQEMDFGRMDGMSGKQAKQAFPKEFRIWARQPEKFHPPGSHEDWKLFQVRLVKAFLRIVRENRGKCVAIVGHGAAFSVLTAKLLGLPLRDYRLLMMLSNSAYRILQIEDDGHLFIDTLEHCEHLPPEWRLRRRRARAAQKRARKMPRRVFYAPLKMTKKERKQYAD